MDDDVLLTEASKMRERAQTLRYQSLFILCLIVGIIGGGTYLFYFAGQLAEDTIEKLHDDVVAVKSAVDAGVSQMASDATSIRESYTRATGVLAQTTFELTNLAESASNSLAAASAEFEALRQAMEGSELTDTNELVETLNAIRVDVQSSLESATDTAEVELKALWNPSELSPLLPCQRTPTQDGADGTPSYLCPVDLVDPVLAQTKGGCEQSKVNTTNGLMDLFRCTGASSAAPDFTASLQKFEGIVNVLDAELASISPTAIPTVRLSTSGDEAIREMENIASALQQVVADFPAGDVLANAPTDFAAIETLSRLSSDLQIAINSMVGTGRVAQSTEGQFYRYIDETTIRITVVVLIIFLVQIFVNLFRYNTRLAGFYDARADAILLAHRSGLQVTSNEFHSLVSSLAPDSIDFGRSPKSPIDSAVELSRQILAISKR